MGDGDTFPTIEDKVGNENQTMTNMTTPLTSRLTLHKYRKNDLSEDNIYLGNPNLKKANTPIEFTEENIIEYIKCKEDPVYFANNYIKIVSLDEGLTQFHPYDFQEKLINNFHNNRFNICKMLSTDW